MPDKKDEKEKDDDVSGEEEGSLEGEESSVSASDGDQNGEEDMTTALASRKGGNTHLRRLINSNFIEYASYVIKDRAIPELNDGLKPVQRRILWSLFRIDDGKFHKVANVIGHSMQFNPHGDASIYEALVVLANKEYFIERQGNFGNIFTGDRASAARCIACRLTPLARETLFNNDITGFVDSYDGRNKEPVFFPSKVPALLMLGSDGIAPGMTTRILPHNFRELLEAQIAILKGESFEVYPDFPHGGVMDVADYDNGNGKIQIRAKIDIVGRKLIIREIPASTTTESLIASIEKAVNKNKIKVASINDYTTDKIEIEIVPARGYDPQKALNALYAYTDCSVSISVSLLVIKENRPLVMNVPDVLRHYTETLVEYLRRELQIELGKLNDKFHEKTLAQIFIENRIYKRIEKCSTYELVLSEVRAGLDKFKHMLMREITDEDIEKLLAIPIRRISLFDMNKNKQDIDDILLSIAEVEKNLKRIKNFTIKYIQGLIERFAKDCVRRTEIEKLDRVDKKAVALNNIKVGWDRKNCYVGTNVKSDDVVTCNEFDKLLCIERKGKYTVIGIPEKTFIERLCYFNKHDKSNIFSIIYRDVKGGGTYAKRCAISKFITDKEYRIIPEGCKIEVITTREGSIYECDLETGPRQKHGTLTVDFSQIGIRSSSARGFKLASKGVEKFVYKGQAETPPLMEGQDGGEASAETEAESADESTESSVGQGQAEKLSKSAEPKSAPPHSKHAPVPASAGAEKEDADDSFTLEAPDEAVDQMRKRKRRETSKSSAPAVKLPVKQAEAGSGQDGDEDWGILQPDLCF